MVLGMVGILFRSLKCFHMPLSHHEPNYFCTDLHSNGPDNFLMSNPNRGSSVELRLLWFGFTQHVWNTLHRLLSLRLSIKASGEAGQQSGHQMSLKPILNAVSQLCRGQRWHDYLQTLSADTTVLQPHHLVLFFFLQSQLSVKCFKIICSPEVSFLFREIYFSSIFKFVNMFTLSKCMHGTDQNWPGTLRRLLQVKLATGTLRVEWHSLA